MAGMPSLSLIIPTPVKEISCQELLVSPGVVMQGVLRKMPSKRKRRLFGISVKMKWKTRFVVIANGCVYMFRNESSSHYRRAMSLFGFSEVVRDDSHYKRVPWAFKVADALEDKERERSLFFLAHSKESMMKWMESFRHEIMQANFGRFRGFVAPHPRHSSSSSVFIPPSPKFSPSESSTSLPALMPQLSYHQWNKLNAKSSGQLTSAESSSDDDYIEIIDDDNDYISDDDQFPPDSIVNRPRLPIPSEPTFDDTSRKTSGASSISALPFPDSMLSPRHSLSPQFKFWPPTVHQHTALSTALGKGGRSPNRSPITSASRSPKDDRRRPGKSPLPAKPRAVTFMPNLPDQRSMAPDCDLAVEARPLPDLPDCFLPPKLGRGKHCPRNKPLPPLPLSEDASCSDDTPDQGSHEEGSPNVSVTGTKQLIFVFEQNLCVAGQVKDLDDTSSEEKDEDKSDDFQSSYLASASFWSGDRDEAERVMNEIKEDGVFMIRNAADGQDYKTLIVRCGLKIKKYKIIRNEGELYSLHLGNIGFTTVTDLLEYYLSNHFPNDTATLTRPYSEVWSRKAESQTDL